ncbi:MAG: dehalogenase [Chloroflexi bacterium]|nr:dehalogenase [Chloroflexota bacterium]
MWLTIGIVIGILIMGLIWFLTKKQIKMAWYVWLLIAVGLLLLLFTLQNFFASFSEHETKAAWMFLLVTGLPSIIILLAAWQIALRTSKKSEI